MLRYSRTLCTAHRLSRCAGFPPSRTCSSSKKKGGAAAQKAGPPEVSLPDASQTTEDSMFYERYLNKKIRNWAPHELTGLWLRGLGKNSGDTASRASATGDPMQTFRDPSTSLDAATASLETMIASIHSGTSDKARLRDEFCERSLGTQALRWYLQSDAHNRFDLSLYPMFFKLLAHSMVAERQEDDLWSLLRVEGVATKSTDWGSQVKWKASLLRQMVEANSYWADDSKSFNNAHRCFRRAFTDRVTTANYIPKYRAGEYLDTFVCKTQARYLSADALDEFILTICYWSTEPFHREFKMSRLHLFHPQKPNPEPAIALLRHVDAQKIRSDAIRDIVGQRSAAGASMLFLYIITTAKTLNRQGRVRDAHWVLDFGRKEMPDYFKHGGKSYSNIESTERRRKATSAEISRGVRVDSEGYRKISEKTMEYYKIRKAADNGEWLPINEKSGHSTLG